MIVDTIDKKNDVILSRNESKVSQFSTQNRYRITFTDGRACTLLDPNKDCEKNVLKRMMAKFGDRFNSLERIL